MKHLGLKKILKKVVVENITIIFNNINNNINVCLADFPFLYVLLKFCGTNKLKKVGNLINILYYIKQIILFLIAFNHSYSVKH